MNKKTFAPSELIINEDGSIFHLHLTPQQIADKIMLVGDPGRVSLVASYFDEKEFEVDYSDTKDLPYTIEIVDGVYVVEGPRIEKMFGYTNLESEKGFDFFQKFLKTSGILDELEKMGIQDKDTVRMYGYEFDYYK